MLHSILIGLMSVWLLSAYILVSISVYEKTVSK